MQPRDANPKSGSDELPPHSIEAEQGILGCIMLAAAEVLPLVQAAIGPEAFYHLPHRTIYDAVLAMASDGIPIDPITLWQRLKDAKELDGIGGIGFLSSLPDTVPSAANLEYYLDIVREKYTLRAFDKACAEAKAQLDANPNKAGIIVSKASEALLAISNASNGDSRVRKLIASRKFDPATPPADNPAVYTIRDVPTCTRGNLTAIDAHTKAGKTALIGAMIASALKPEDFEADTFGITSANQAGFALLHFDTEQSRDDHWKLIDRVRRRAGLKVLPEWFLSFWLAGIPLRDLEAIITEELNGALKRFGGIHSTFIDGVADLVANVNDPCECNAYVSALHGQAIEFNCPIIGVIHSNPNSDKTRGHLGSQLERKAESNLTMEKNGEVTTIWSVKQRGAPILKGHGPSFQWSSEAGMHVSCPAGSAGHSAKLQQMLCERDDVFLDHPAMRYSDLITTAMRVLGKSQRTAQGKVSEWRKHGLIVQSAAKLWIKAA